MEAQALHDLTAAYALDALNPDEAREYEAHLSRCEQCRTDLASFGDAAAALAYGVDAPEPPAQLRGRILERARAERPNVVPLRPRWALPAAAAAAVAAVAVVVLALWASSLSDKVGRLQAARDRGERAAAILSAPGARSVPIPGDRGRLVVTPGGEGALVLTRLAPAQSGRTYEAWVARDGMPKPAGVFDSTGDVTAVPLDQPVPAGATVMVTQERHRVDLPTRSPFITVTTS
jgi:anti-sigma factor RsiW